MIKLYYIILFAKMMYVLISGNLRKTLTIIIVVSIKDDVRNNKLQFKKNFNNSKISID